MKASLSIAVPSKKIIDPEAIARFAEESNIPNIGGVDEPGFVAVAPSPATAGLPVPTQPVLNVSEASKLESTVIFKMTKRDRDLLDAVFAKSSYKSRRAMFEAEFVPRLEEMAKELGVAV
jgi:hypothetical protein